MSPCFLCESPATRVVTFTVGDEEPPIATVRVEVCGEHREAAVAALADPELGEAHVTGEERSAKWPGAEG